METTGTGRVAARHGLLLIITAALLWGTVGITTRALYGLAATTPLSIGFFRLALAVPVLLLGCWPLVGRQFFRVGRHDLGLMVLIGAMTALYQVCYFAAIARCGVAVATLVTLCTAPVLVALLSVIFLGEKPTGRTMAALLLALGGTALLVGGGPVGVRGAGGVLLALGSAFGYAVVALATRTLAGRYHPLQPIAISFAIGALVLLAAVIPQGLVVSYPPTGWLLLGYLGVVPTALAYVLFISGIRHTTATVASICTLLEPLTSTVLAWLLFAERLGRGGIAGAALLTGAILLLYAGGRKGRRE